ncbi:hypothetical protein ACFLU0_00545 [Chloroflexota bacterium]
MAFTVFRPMVVGEKYSEVQRESLLKTEEGWIIQFDLINNEGEDQSYTISLSIDDDKPYKEDVFLPDGRIYRFVRRIHAGELAGDTGRVDLVIYKNDESTPIEHLTYYLE